MAQREGFQAFPMGRGEALHGRRPVRAELRAGGGIRRAAPAPFAPGLPTLIGRVGEAPGSLGADDGSQLTSCSLPSAPT